MKPHLIQCENAETAARTAAHINSTGPAQVKARVWGDTVRVSYDAPIAEIVAGLFVLVPLVVALVADLWRLFALSRWLPANS